MTRKLDYMSFEKFLDLPFNVTAEIVMALPLSHFRGRSPWGLKGCSTFFPFGTEKTFLGSYSHAPYSREELGEREDIIMLNRSFSNL